MSYTSRSKGFSLIELMVTISIISFLSSIMAVALSSSRAKAFDGQTMALVKQNQTGLAMAENEAGLPVTPENEYFCLGKSASESCTWAGATIYGHVALAGYSVWSQNTPTKTIDGETYTSGVYQCTEVVNGVCTKASIYWALQTHSSCPFGLLVTADPSGQGVICGQDAGSNTTDDVVVGGGGGFDYTITPPSNPVVYLPGEIIQVQTTITKTAGTAEPVTISDSALPSSTGISFSYPNGSSCIPDPVCTINYTINYTMIPPMAHHTWNGTVSAVSAQSSISHTGAYTIATWGCLQCLE